MNIIQRMLHWLWKELQKISVAKEEAARWQILPKCRFCGKVLLVECTFCMHCGMSQTPIERQTTGSLPPVESASQLLRTHKPKYSRSQLVSLYEDEEKKP